MSLARASILLGAVLIVLSSSARALERAAPRPRPHRLSRSILAGRRCRSSGSSARCRAWQSTRAIVDYKGNVWLSSAGGPRMGEGKENFLLKFTPDGKFLLQVGRRGMSQGSLDTRNVNNAADMWVHPATNEVFVADGYINRRVLVLDADTSAFKRMWGAYGNAPDDKTPEVFAGEGPGPAQFNTVHGIKVSNDGLVYVNDRLNNRVQVFTVDGKFQSEIFIERKTRLLGTSFNTAFSPDREQRWLYVADAGNGRRVQKLVPMSR
jgi:hypothetical protein